MTEGAKRYYPAFLDLTGRLCVVIGSGKAAERRALQLARYGGDVTIITPDPSADLLEAQTAGSLVIEDRDYVRGDLAGAAIVFCMASDEETKHGVAVEARTVGCPANISDSPNLSSFLVPGIVHREPLQIAVSTGGASPEFSKRIRRRIAEDFDETWQAYARMVAEVRALAAERLGDREAVVNLVEAVLDSDLLERIKAGTAPTAGDVYEEFAPEVEHEADTADEAGPEEDSE